MAMDLTAGDPAARLSAPAGISSGAEKRRVVLPAGSLDVAVTRATLPLDDLCDFAARRNPKRGFLFVSKVLGRHMPAAPAAMRASYARLAEMLPADLPGPVVVLGMAETAIALGHGVQQEYRHATGRRDVVYQHTTRYALDRPVAARFQEEHSHASAHILYRPEGEAGRLFDAARSLILVDDEVSTGKTFDNLAHALAPALPNLERLALAVLTDWSGGAAARKLRQSQPLAGGIAALLSGTYWFTANPDAPPVDMPNVIGSGGFKDALLTRNFGRLGVVDVPEIDPGLVDRLAIAPGSRVLVLGTGEFVFPPFLLAEAIAARGAEVFCQATTRSPILPGFAIGATLSFRDNYADDIPNFVYNVRREDYDRILICYETGAETVQADLIAALGAEAIQL